MIFIVISFVSDNTTVLTHTHVSIVLRAPPARSAGRPQRGRSALGRIDCGPSDAVDAAQRTHARTPTLHTYVSIILHTTIHTRILEPTGPIVTHRRTHTLSLHARAYSSGRSDLAVGRRGADGAIILYANRTIPMELGIAGCGYSPMYTRRYQSPSSCLTSRKRR
jgi:hypothetical protein